MQWMMLLWSSCLTKEQLSIFASGNVDICIKSILSFSKTFKLKSTFKKSQNHFGCIEQEHSVGGGLRKYLETLQCGRSPPRSYTFEFISSPQGSPSGGQRDETRMFQCFSLVFHFAPIGSCLLSSLFCPSCCSSGFEVLINFPIRLVLLLNHFNLSRWVRVSPSVPKASHLSLAHLFPLGQAVGVEGLKFSRSGSLLGSFLQVFPSTL